MIIGKARQVHFVKRVSHARVILVWLSLAARKQPKCLALVEDKIRSSYLLQVENMKISEKRSMVSFLLVSHIPLKAQSGRQYHASLCGNIKRDNLV